MIPVKDARKVLYDSATEKSLSDLQDMFGGVVAFETLSTHGTVGRILALEFSPAVDGFTFEPSPSTDSVKVHLRNGDAIELGYFIEGVTIPFYFIDYISD